ncbi:MAG: ferredoxin [Bacilli bacterium]
MKVKVISDNCIGCGQCEAICDEVFNIQDDGFAHAINEEIKDDLKDDVNDAASSCPTSAIEIENA